MKYKVTASMERIMNDVKYADKEKAWIGFDLDGTLAKYDGWKGWQYIGDPVEKMVGKAKDYINRGLTVKILTARCSKVSLARSEITFDQMTAVIQDWTEKHIGMRLEVVTEKDCDMLHFFDDSCVQVEPSTGNIIGSEIMVDLGDEGDFHHPIKEYISSDVNHQDHWNETKIDTACLNDFTTGLLHGGYANVQNFEATPSLITFQATKDDNVSRFSLYTCDGNVHNEPTTLWVVIDVSMSNGSNRMFYKIDNLSFKSLGYKLARQVLAKPPFPVTVQQQ